MNPVQPYCLTPPFVQRPIKFTEQTSKHMIAFLMKRCKETTVPLSGMQVWNEYKKSANTKHLVLDLYNRFRQTLAPRIQSYHGLTADTKIRILFAMNCPMTRAFYDHASRMANIKLEVDSDLRVLKYENPKTAVKLTAFDADGKLCATRRRYTRWRETNEGVVGSSDEDEEVSLKRKPLRVVISDDDEDVPLKKKVLKLVVGPTERKQPIETPLAIPLSPTNKKSVEKKQVPVKEQPSTSKKVQALIGTEPAPVKEQQSNSQKEQSPQAQAPRNVASVEKKQAPVQELQTITEEQPVSTGKEQAPVPEPRAPPKEQLPPASIPEPQALQAPILQHSSIDKEAVPENSPNTMRAIVLLRKLKFLALSLESSELLCFVKEINAKIDEKFDDVANRLVRIDELHETLEMALNFISLNATSSPSSEAHHTTWKNFLRCLQSVIISVNGAEFREMEERIDREIRGEMDKQIPTSKIRLALQNIIAMTIKN